MSRKRTQRDLRGVDQNDSGYWEELLKRDGLTMEAGRSKRLVYVGGTSEVDLIHGLSVTDNGHVRTDENEG